MGCGEIVIIDVITGGQVAVLSSRWARALTFSLDGIFLVSGGDDETVKLWDVQTGGVVKTFHGHTQVVNSVSISPDGVAVASGSQDNTIRLWHVQAGDCFCVIEGFNNGVCSVSFSPTNPQLLVSASGDSVVQQWDIDGHQIGPTCKGWGAAFSSDGTYFVSWEGQVATVWNSDSRAIVAELQVSSDHFQCCCFSPNGKLVAGVAGITIYIWDITGSDPHLIETLIGHTLDITSLIFPSSLISASKDNTVKFWQIGAPSTDSAATDKMATLPWPIDSVSLQVREGVVISSDSVGVVKVWDILTGLCKASIQTPAPSHNWKDVQLIEGRLIVVWHPYGKLCIWDGEKGEYLQRVNMPRLIVRGVRISEDGSKVFCLLERSIQVWSMQTGEVVGKVELEGDALPDPLHAGGSRFWVSFKGPLLQGWDFGTSNFSPTLLSNIFPNRPRLDFIHSVRDTRPSRIRDTVTGKEVFQLVGRYATPNAVRWDGQYLAAGYDSGEVLILNFNHVLLQ